MKRGIFIGRFQPFHNAHLSAVRWACERVDELIIGIGSANLSLLPTNPFTAGERYEMIRGVLRADLATDINQIHLIPIPDIFYWSCYISHVELFVPSFQHAFEGSQSILDLFEEKGYTVHLFPRFKGLSGTAIRQKILEHKPWMSEVPTEVFDFVTKIRGEERIREILKGEK